MMRFFMQNNYIPASVLKAENEVVLEMQGRKYGN